MLQYVFGATADIDNGHFNGSMVWRIKKKNKLALMSEIFSPLWKLDARWLQFVKWKKSLELYRQTSHMIVFDTGLEYGQDYGFIDAFNLSLSRIPNSLQSSKRNCSKHKNTSEHENCNRSDSSIEPLFCQPNADCIDSFRNPTPHDKNRMCGFFKM